MKFNIVPLKGKRDSYTKIEVRKNFPKWKKVDFYTDPIPADANTMMMTGVHPLYPNLQIVVLDFDGPSHGRVGWNGLSYILSLVRTNKFEPYMVRRTGNGGFHLIYICDTEYIFRNEHNRGLSDTMKVLLSHTVGDIDIRANGGLVFWDCKFSDTDKYVTITKQFEIEVISSLALHEFVDKMRPPVTHTLRKKLVGMITSTVIVDDRKDITMYNCNDYGIPEKHFHVFNQLRQAIKDIWTGAYIITKTNNEFQKWGIFWRECLARGMPEYIILDRLRSGVQPEYNEEDTLTQLRCLKYKDISPKREYYNRVFPEYKSFYR